MQRRFLSTAARFTRNLASGKALQPQFRVQTRNLATVRFAESHEYVSLDGDIATIGITAHAADALGDIVYVDLPSVGAEFSAGDAFGAVESVKAASDIYSPVDGEVVDVNSTLDDSPGVVNEAPMADGWIMKLKVGEVGVKDFDKLMSEDDYKKHCEEE